MSGSVIDICPACGLAVEAEAHVIRDSETGQGFHFLCWATTKDGHAEGDRCGGCGRWWWVHDRQWHDVPSPSHPGWNHITECPECPTQQVDEWPS